jgi:glucans biosynthesis protein
MSAPEVSRSFVFLAVLLLPAFGCGVSEEESTLPSDSREANPMGQVVDLALEPATPGTIAEHVRAKARVLAGREYSGRDTQLPASLANLDYSDYRSIRYRPAAALWKDASPFEVQLLPRGGLFSEAVQLHVVGSEQVLEMPFDPTLFSFEGRSAQATQEDRAALGYSGFRVHYPLNRPEVADEIVVFQGASYFRLLGPGHVHGLSSRGLAIDIGEYAGEEFPDFTEFWLVEPSAGDRTLVFYALLDSPSVTGAYRFELEPGTETALHVSARLFARHDVNKLGVAPLSSMFLYGPNEARNYDDFRPEVHDSDGLMMLTRVGEWIWRPLANRQDVRVTALRDGEPQGFGLAQRARNFDQYLDLETSYHRRPSEWVERVGGDWGVGGVELLGAAAPPPVSQRRVVVDFSSGGQVDDRTVGVEAAVVEAVIDVSAGEVSDVRTSPLPDEAGWRVSFRLSPAGSEPADMRLHLVRGKTRVSESWSYVWYPEGRRIPTN